jgi:hypothetical protein
MRLHCDIVGPEPHCSRCGVPARVMNLRRHCPARRPGPCGVGCQLARLLSWVAKDDGTCGCTEYAALMDSWGPDGCEERIDGIVEHLLDQAAKRSIVLGAVPAAVVVPLVRAAIAAARREAAPTRLEGGA